MMQKLLNGLLPYLWLAIAVLVIFSYTLSFDFVHFDDTKLVLRNLNFISNPNNIGEVFKHDVFYPDDRSAYYRPMLTLSFMFDALIGKEKPFVYFLTNILLHIIASMLVFRFFVVLINKRELAFFISLIFAVHPILTQAIAWLPGRNDPLLAIFVLPSFLFFVKFIGTKKPRDFVMHILFFVLALFTKELAVVLPVLCVFYIFTIARTKMPSGPTLMTFVASWIGAGVLLFLSRSNALNGAGIPFISSLKSIIKNSGAIFLYIGKIFLPINLSALPTLKDSSLWYGVAVALAVSILLLLSKKKRAGVLIFGISWFLLFLVPSFFSDDPSTIDIFYEHRVYIALVGLLLVITEIDFIQNIDFKKNILAIVVIGCIIVLFAARAFWHSGNFKNRLNFWQHAVETAPNLPRSHSGLGSAYLDAKQYDLAETEYRKGIVISPNEQILHGNLGLLLLQKGQFEEAEKELKKELEVNKKNMDTWLNLGVIYYRQKRFSEVKTVWEEAISTNPNYLPIHENLAIYYFDIENNPAEAAKHIRAILERGGSVQKELLDALREIHAL